MKIEDAKIGKTVFYLVEDRYGEVRILKGPIYSINVDQVRIDAGAHYKNDNPFRTPNNVFETSLEAHRRRIDQINQKIEKLVSTKWQWIQDYWSQQS